jgi:DNA-binding response OmpR family regulator
MRKIDGSKQPHTDDHEDILEVVKMVLEMAGYEVSTSLTGAYFQQMENDLPDLILLDVLLSGEGGREIVND